MYLIELDTDFNDALIFIKYHHLFSYRDKREKGKNTNVYIIRGYKAKD